jgi:DNA helicase-2/ATP-dependent DNA helicase PcrA
VSLERIIDNFPLGRGFGPKALETVRTWATLNNVPSLDGFLAFTANAVNSGPALSGAARTAAQRIGDVFARLRAQKDDLTLAELFDAVVERTGYQASFNNEDEEEMQRWANVLELRGDLERYDVVSPNEALATYLEQVSLIADVDSMKDDDRGLVTLITLHSAKGLEFPVVFIAGVEEGLLPISRAVEAEFHDPLPMEEERRLFYVGITRAQRVLVITYAGNRLTYGQFRPAVASRFLAAVPSNNMRSLGRRATERSHDRVRLQDQARGRTAGHADYASPLPAVSTPLAKPPAYRPGQRVFHSKFGEGQIVDVNERRDDQELGVTFVRHGTRRLLASMANLDLISDEGA